MSTEATDPSKTAAAPATEAAPVDKGKGKAVAADGDTSMDSVEDDDEEEDEEEDDEEEDDDDDEEEEDLDPEIDPAAILAPGARRSTRGARVDYSSAEALQKAGLKQEDLEEEDDEMKE